MRSSAFVLSALLCLATPAHSRAPDEAERFWMGDYVIREVNDDRVLCRVTVAWGEDVGGQFVTHGCEALPDLDEALRWWNDAETNEALFEDALHAIRFRLHETEAGFLAVTAAGKHYWFDVDEAATMRR